MGTGQLLRLLKTAITVVTWIRATLISPRRLHSTYRIRKANIVMC